MDTSRPSTYEPDPAGVFATALSLWQACRMADAEHIPMHGGYDDLLRQIMHIATAFEAWACKHIEFEELTDCWPYLLESSFGEVCLNSLRSDGLFTFNDVDCLRVAIKLRLPVRVEDSIEVPIKLFAANPNQGSHFISFKIATSRLRHKDGAKEPYTVDNAPFDPNYGPIFFSLFGVVADGNCEHIADRPSYETTVELATRLVTGIKFPTRPVLTDGNCY